jgi:hypothetical protein
MIKQKKPKKPKITLKNWIEEYEKFDDLLFDDLMNKIQDCAKNPAKYNKLFHAFAHGILNSNRVSWEILYDISISQFLRIVPKALRKNIKFKEEYKDFLINTIGSKMNPKEMDPEAPTTAELLKKIKVD